MLIIPNIKPISDDGLFVAFGRCEYGEYAKDTEDTVFQLYNRNFDVTINGRTCKVMECRVSAIPFNRPWPGKQRPYTQSESAGHLSFYADEAVSLTVKSKKSFSTAKVRPLSKNIKTEISNDGVSFRLTEYGSYVLELDGTHNVLHIFFNPIKQYPDAEKATYYFGPGIHFPQLIYLRDNDTVYVDKEAIVFGSIYTDGAKNVRIFGGGIIDNSCEERLVENCYEKYSKGTFRIYHSENIEVSDVIFVNSSNWIMAMFGCHNITIDNVKLVGHWRYNTDCIDIVNSSDVIIKNSFLRSFDDTISIKAIYDCETPIENITVDHCVMWCGWSKNCEVGIESCGKEYRNICFKNTDLIHSSYSALSISNGGYARIHDVIFENLNIELQNDVLEEQIQTEDSQAYTGYGKHMRTVFVVCSNRPYALRQKSDKLVRKACDKLGTISDVSFKNIHIIAEDIDYKPQIKLESIDPSLPCKGFAFEDIYVNGVKQTDFSAFDTSFINAENITVK